MFSCFSTRNKNKANQKNESLDQTERPLGNTDTSTSNLVRQQYTYTKLCVILDAHMTEINCMEPLPF